MQGDARREAMRSVIEQRGFVSTADLAAEFGVSEVTVRSDVASLEAAGVERVHGGAVLRPAGAEQPFELAASTLVDQKRRIGEAAAALVPSGAAIAIDVGTTGVAVAQALVRRADLERVTVITNSLSAALALEPAIPRFDVIVSGGTLRPLQHSLVAPFAAEGFRRLRVDTAFIGCTGVDAEHGVTNINVAEAELKRVIASIASRVVVVADASKLDHVDAGHVLALDEISALVTGREAPAPAVASLQAVGVAVELA